MTFVQLDIDKGKIITMKQIIVYLLLSTLLFSFSTVKDLTPSNEGSSVKFVIKNFGANVNGSFTGLQGNISFDNTNLAAAVFKVSIDANTVNTGIKMRDNHLRKEDYFDVTKYPRITFTSGKITAGSTPGSYQVTGKLTLKNATKDITFPFTAVPKDGGILFTGSFKINRRDFGVGGNSAVMNDNVTINLSILGK